MTRKPDGVFEATATPVHAPGQHPHILPVSGGSYTLVDGQPVAEPPSTSAPVPPSDPEV